MNDFIAHLLYLLRYGLRHAAAAMLVCAVIFGVVWLLFRAKYKGEKTFPWGRGILLLLLAGYLVILAYVTLFRMSGVAALNLRPFLAFGEAWNSFSLRRWLNPLLNIAVFVPLGILLPLLASPFRRWYLTLGAGLGGSLLVEVSQYVFKMGLADVDDLFCNTLGTMLGYCLCMLFISLTGKRWKIAGAYAALPVLTAAALAGIFLAYYLQPYGNLADGPIYAANTKGVEWVRECPLSDEPGTSGVYWGAPFTRESCDAFAVEFLAGQGAEIRFGTPDVNYYDDCAFYSDHSTYALWVNYTDRSYEYTDYRVDDALRFSGKGGTMTEEELRAALETLGVKIPGAARFAAVDEEKGKYVFRAKGVVEDGMLTNGELTCWVAEGGILYKVDNAISVSALHGDAAVISPREAYARLCAGRFSWRDVPMFDELSPGQVRVTACELEYLTDSKGFRQPVYVFTLSDENDGELRGGSGWTTFVPALAG